MKEIEVETRTTEEDALEMAEEIGNITEEMGGIFQAKFKRICDGCNQPVGEKYKGEGMKEYCEDCCNRNQIPGEFKINKYLEEENEN